MPEYSVWYPATSSLSARAGRTARVPTPRLPPKKKTRKPTACGMTNQSVASCFEDDRSERSDWPIIDDAETLSAS
jgi:hypothetical protein